MINVAENAKAIRINHKDAKNAKIRQRNREHTQVLPYEKIIMGLRDGLS